MKTNLSKSLIVITLALLSIVGSSQWAYAKGKKNVGLQL